MRRSVLRTAALSVLACIVLPAWQVQAPKPSRSSPRRPVIARALVQKAQAKPVETIGVPVGIAIPAIGVEAEVEPLGLLEGGKLDAPKNAEDTGWYALGAKPGETGNAVIDGHLTLGKGDGVFRRLSRVRPGDEIQVRDDKGKTRVFAVRETAVYDVDKAPMQEIFGPTDRKRLNLITCAGVWRTDLDHYDKRLIVYTELIKEL
jgi:sortase A